MIGNEVIPLRVAKARHRTDEKEAQTSMLTLVDSMDLGIQITATLPTGLLKPEPPLPDELAPDDEAGEEEFDGLSDDPLPTEMDCLQA